MNRRVEFALWLVLAIVVYVNACIAIYSMAHPSLTYTEVWFDAWRAVTWDW